MITVLFFSVSWQTVSYENVNAMPSLLPLNWLLLVGWQLCISTNMELNTKLMIKWWSSNPI